MTLPFTGIYAPDLQDLTEKIKELDDYDRCSLEEYIEQLLEDPKYFIRSLSYKGDVD